MASLTGSTTAVFFVRLSTAVDEIVDVDWNTRDGTAIAGKDYEAASGTVSFLPGETEKAIDVVVYGQGDVSADGKKFYIELKPPANAVLTDALAECVITVADEEGVLVTSLVIAQGKRGLKGNPGLSAYEQAVLMGYTGTVEQWMDEIGDASQAAVRAESFASQAAESAVVAGQKADEATEAVGSTKQYVDSALSGFAMGAENWFPTLAAANAAIATIEVGKSVWVGDEINGGLWYKATEGATSLTKSAYDPLLQSTEYVDDRVGFGKNTNKFFEFVDANGVPILSIFKNLSVWIPGLKKDIASSINSLNKLFDYISIGSSNDIVVIKDVNNAPVLRISKNLEVDIGKYRLKALSGAINDLRAMLFTASGSDFLRIIDKNSLPLLRLTSNHDLLIPKVGNLTQTILKLSSSSEKQTSTSLGGGGGSEGADLVLATLNEKQSSGTLSALTASMVNNLNIFPHSVNLIRIPAITRIQKNKFLCFFEARVDGDDFGRNSQGVCTLTVDTDSFTVTANNIQSLHAAEPHTTVAGAFYTFMNACAVKLDSGRIIALYVKRYGTGEHYIYKRYSDDDGATWSEYEDIGTQLNMDFYNLLCPCSQGLVKRHGSFKGRIIFPVWYSGRTYNFQEFRAGYIYSDDQGETWHDGAFNSETRSNEVQCAEDMNGDILFCIRREIVGDDAKTWAKLYDGNFELTPFKSKRIINVTHVMSGLIQARNNFDLSIPKFQYIGTHSAGRRNLKIFTSYDAGLNWVNEYDVPGTSSGSVYSCIERLDEYYTFALWENPGVNEFKCQILALNDLITNK